MDEAVRMLSNDYTYSIISKDEKQRNSRKTIGKMASEIAKLMSEELMTTGIKLMLEAEHGKD